MGLGYLIVAFGGFIPTGGLIVLAQQMFTVPFAATPLWMHIATAFERLAG
ncbi:MAG TPA: hypothetical protein VNV61_10830 [Steroidobacteraceae bacterium]|jgi:hypothetical protein|nr:hypothetical protein [Steroidobacteraceae bacterium]